MLRALSIAAAIAAVCGTLAAFGSSAAVAASPHGTLTSTEYERLSTAITALKKSLSGKKLNWQAAEAACQAIGGGSPLLTTQRESCVDDLALSAALVKFEVDQEKCAAKVTKKTGTGTTATTPATTTATTPVATTTTPATTTPATTPTTTTATTTTPATTTTTTPSTTTTTPTSGFSKADLKLVACLDPDYQSLGRLAKLNYTVDVSARKDAVVRGFKGKCLATLVSTAAQIRDEESFAFSAKHLASDVALITKVDHGKASPSKLNETWIADDARDFVDAAATLESETSPQKLSVCPHAPAATK